MRPATLPALRLFLAVATGIAWNAATAGPFGLSQGMSQQELAKRFPIQEAGGTGLFKAISIPGGHPDLEDYLFVVGEKRGLCRILATTKTDRADSYGDIVRHSFAKWEEDLTARYGAGERYELLKSGSLWNTPRDWMMALYRNERFLEKHWSAASVVDPELQSVTLTAMAPTSGTFFITIRYDFNNEDGCTAENRERNRSRL